METTERTGAAAGVEYRELRNELEDVTERIANLIRERPALCLLFAFGVGYAAGLFASRR